MTFQREWAAMKANAEADAGITHVGGVPWHAAPIPHRRHRCKRQTSGWAGLNQWERCACGAIRQPSWGNVWLERNSRRANHSCSTEAVVKLKTRKEASRRLVTSAAVFGASLTFSLIDGDRWWAFLAGFMAATTFLWFMHLWRSRHER